MITFLLKCIGRLWLYMDENACYWAVGMRRKGMYWKKSKWRRIFGKKI